MRATGLTQRRLRRADHRTTTGKFFGDYLISTELEALIHLMTDPSVHLRMQSCATALRHRFFEQSPPSSSARHAPGTPSSYSTPSRSKGGNKAVQTPTSTISGAKQKVTHASPRQTPKKAAFAIFQDADPAPSPAPSTRSTSSFEPRPLALADRASTNLTPAPATPILKKPVAPPVPASAVVASPRPTVKSPPAPSRIPVRRTDVVSPVAPASAKRFVSGPLTSPIRTATSVRPRVVSQPLLSSIRQPLDVDVVSPSAAAAAVAVAAPTRSGSLKMVKRKPAPTFSEPECIPASSSKSSRTFVDEQAEEEQVVPVVEPLVVAEASSSPPTSPCASSPASLSVSFFAHTSPSCIAVLRNEDDTTFTTRSYTIEIGKTDGRCA